MAVINKPEKGVRVNGDGTVSISPHRKYVVVSGYYGFDNLGDEAILEEITCELKKLVKAEDIIVLSANPKRTAELFGVGSIERTDLMTIADLCKSARLFVSGGGGLFQNTKSLGSIIFYAFQIALARTFGSPIVIYAQGIGPLRGKAAEWITRKAFTAADAILVRDPASKSMLDTWGLDSVQTADPVWCLEPRKLPASIAQQLDSIKTGKLIGLSLRTSHNFTDDQLHMLVNSMANTLPENAHVVLLPLQINQDTELLKQFAALWQAKGRASTLIDTSSLQYPSEWLTLFSKCRLVIGMRLHALIMSLKAGIPVVGMAYDPKVSHLLAEFEQPSLILTKSANAQEWEQALNTAFTDMDKLARKATKKAESAKKLACQNFNMIDRILGTQKYS